MLDPNFLPSMPLSDVASAEFEELLEDIKPALVVVDSWINCISAAGLDENSSTDIARWTDAYPQRARVRGVAVLLLDHVPKEDNTARGSGRKLDYVDAMWELRNPQRFDRETVGRIDMHLRKDREGWLPKHLTSVGAGKDGFVFRLARTRRYRRSERSCQRAPRPSNTILIVRTKMTRSNQNDQLRT
jgi:hypothetical protein